MRRSDVRAALRASLVYFLVSLVWVALSSQVIAAFTKDRHSLALADSLKIAGYVFLTALVIFFVMQREMAARRSSQEALQLSEERYRTILETTEQGVVVTDLDGCVTFANQKMMQMLGCVPTGIVGKSLRELAADTGKQVIDIDSLVRGQGVREPREVRFSHTDGSLVWAKLSASPLFDAHGQLSGTLAMVTDTTASRQVEQFAWEQRKTLQEHVARLEQRLAERTAALTASNERLNARVYMMSHDLRAPLQDIERTAGVSAGDYKDNQRAGDHLGRIRGAGERTDVLSQDQPAYSDTSRIEPHVGSAHFADIIDEALEQLDGELRAARAQILVQAPMYAVAAHAPTAVRIVANLISNAVKFVAPDVIARVRVWSEDRGNFVRLWVEDNGIGMAVGDQDRIFRAFERLHDVERYPGTGIGLAIAQHGAQRMGGSIGVESVPGNGSRFWLELPRAQC